MWGWLLTAPLRVWGHGGQGKKSWGKVQLEGALGVLLLNEVRGSIGGWLAGCGRPLVAPPSRPEGGKGRAASGIV